MKRFTTIARKDWKTKLENIGFGFHTTNTTYWNEHAYYTFTMKEVEQIESATEELGQMCLEAVQYVIDNGLYDKFNIPEFIIPLIERSWREDHPAIYGRFDFSFNNGELKMLEFNADTPTSLFESAIVQWHWLQDFDPNKDQFNSLHEQLVEYWKYLKPYLNKGPLHFTCVKRSLEDLTTVEYMRDCAMQADIQTKLVFIDDIGWDGNGFVDMENEPITNCFKLYPWEFIVDEPFGKHISEDQNRCFWIEPSWKMILSNKALLPVLWEMFEGHPLLLPSFFSYNSQLGDDYVIKPILSREGANVKIIKDGGVVADTQGEYYNEKRVFQKLAELPQFDGKHALIGSWVIGGCNPAGIGIREGGIVTENNSMYVPHLIED